MMNIQLFRKKLSREIIDLIPSFETNFNVVNVVTFSDTISMINVKLCMAVVLTELYPFIPLSLSLVSVTLIIFQGCSVVKQF